MSHPCHQLHALRHQAHGILINAHRKAYTHPYIPIHIHKSLSVIVVSLSGFCTVSDVAVVLLVVGVSMCVASGCALSLYGLDQLVSFLRGISVE